MSRCCNCQNEINVGAIVCPYCHTCPFIFGSAPYEGIPIGDGVYDPEVAAFGTTVIGGLLCFGPLLPVGLGIIGLAAVRYGYDKIKGR